MTQAEFETVYPIPDQDAVLRNTPIMYMEKMGNRRIPTDSQFFADPDGMSVNWSRMITPEGAMHLLGLTYNQKGKYIDINGFRLFALPVDFLKKLPTLPAVNHSPVLNGDPAAVGKPNNIAHASVLHDNSVEARIKMATYCQDNYENCHCTPDLKVCIEILEKELRPQGDENGFHRLEMM